MALQAAARIIDANLNRAREALRVMEEYARFALDDASLSLAIKEARHDLAGCVPEEVAKLMATGRDVAGDVGRELHTPAEARRADVADVAVAAAKRLSEALRAVEEYAKTVDAHFAAAVGGLRYRGYELERRLSVTCRARRRFGQVKLYVLLTEALCAAEWLETAEAVLAGGADCIQLREKHLVDRELLRRANVLASLCRERGALFIVNDRPDIAVLCNADGVHLGQDDVGVAEARRITRPEMLVGLSTHTASQVSAAADASPDYLAVGPMFATDTKPSNSIAGPELLSEARTITSLPLVAIGGVTADNARTVLSAADCCLAVCSAVIAKADPAAAVASLRAVIERQESA